MSPHCPDQQIVCLGSGFPEGRDLLAGRQEMFTVAMMMYAAASACIGATPAAYAADVMPHSVSGFGLGIYRCAGDIGGSQPSLLLSPVFWVPLSIGMMRIDQDTACHFSGHASDAVAAEAAA